MKNKLNNITNRRIRNALLFDKLLKNNNQIQLVPREKIKEVFHLYHINVKKERQSYKILKIKKYRR